MAVIIPTRIKENMMLVTAAACKIGYDILKWSVGLDWSTVLVAADTLLVLWIGG